VFRFHLSPSQRTLVLSERLCTGMGALNDVFRRLHMEQCVWLCRVLAKLLQCVSGALSHYFIHHESLGLYHFQERGELLFELLHFGFIQPEGVLGV
jgi:hypothetical protein